MKRFYGFVVILFLMACSKSVDTVKKEIKVIPLITTTTVGRDIYTQYFVVSAKLSEAIDVSCDVQLKWYLFNENNAVSDSLFDRLTITPHSTSSARTTNIQAGGDYRGNVKVSLVSCLSDKYTFTY